MGAPYIYDISRLRVKDLHSATYIYVVRRLKVKGSMMMRGVPLETCWAFNERWNNKFCYKVASCWLFPLKQA